MKDEAKTGAKKLVVTTGSKTRELLGNKARGKIVQLFSRKQTKKNQQPLVDQQLPVVQQPLTDYQINERINNPLSGGKLKII